MKGLTFALLTAACASAAQPAAVQFDGARALDHVKALVAIGPRPAGSPAAARTRQYIRQQLEMLGLSVVEQPFDARTPLGAVRMVNLRATVGEPSSSPRLIVAGHYDTKLFANVKFVGANDGGSSTAFLLELARVLKARPLQVPAELLFLDGEEAVVAWRDQDHTYGSRHYVQAAIKDGSLKRIAALVLIDMVGDRDLRIKRESQSTPWLTDIIWNTARTLGRIEFVDESTPIEDDHIPFLEAGVPAVDLIDLDYPDWHQPGDTLDKLSAASLQAVGDVVVRALPEIAARVRK